MLYILGMPQKVITAQNRVLKVLSGKIDDFYLGGGTALSLFYFNHRESLDLDFFTKDFSKKRIMGISGFISNSLKKRMELVAEESRKTKVKILIFSLAIDKKTSLKIDFIQDYMEHLKPLRLINGINILSIEDIYSMKIRAITGTLQTTDYLGRRIFKGGRQEAKDFYDLYCLSQVFMRLSDFSFRYLDPLTREAIIRWFSTYKRFDMKIGLMELRLNKDIDFGAIEQHFKKEVSRIIEKEVG